MLVFIAECRARTPPVLGDLSAFVQVGLLSFWTVAAGVYLAKTKQELPGESKTHFDVHSRAYAGSGATGVVAVCGGIVVEGIRR